VQLSVKARMQFRECYSLDERKLSSSFIMSCNPHVVGGALSPPRGVGPPGDRLSRPPLEQSSRDSIRGFQSSIVECFLIMSAIPTLWGELPPRGWGPGRTLPKGVVVFVYTMWG
jgi:hypothetical protein